MRYWTLALALLGAGVQAVAHEAPSGWTYPLRCCSEQDCRPVPDNDVEERPDGFLVKSLDKFIPRERAEPSGDEHFHICLWPNGGLICFFYPPRGF